MSERFTRNGRIEQKRRSLPIAPSFPLTCFFSTDVDPDSQNRYPPILFEIAHRGQLLLELGTAPLSRMMGTRPMSTEFGEMDLANRQFPVLSLPLDAVGRPTSCFVFDLVRFFSMNREAALSIEDILDMFYLDPKLSKMVQMVCRQLRVLDVLEQDPPASEQYRYSRAKNAIVLREKAEQVIDAARDDSPIWVQSLPDYPQLHQRAA